MIKFGPWDKVPPTFIAEFPVEAGLAVADLPRGRGGPDVDAPAVAAAVLVLAAVVLVLTPVAVEARLAATPAGERPAVAAAAVLPVLARRHHGDVGARPEEVARRPLAGLADEPEGALFAGEAVGEGDGKALCPATSCFTCYCWFCGSPTRIRNVSPRLFHLHCITGRGIRLATGLG